MSRLILIFIFLLPLIVGCGFARISQKPNSWLPELWYVDQQYNQAIVNREPDYGIDGKDGNVVKNEFMINIDDIKIDSVQNRLQLNGMIIGKETKERLWGVNLEVVSPQKKLIRDGESSVFKGRFILESNFFENDLIKVSQVGYRTLFIDLSKIIGQLKKQLVGITTALTADRPRSSLLVLRFMANLSFVNN